MAIGRAGVCARVTLAAIRIVNGSTALVAPSLLTRRIGVDPSENQAARYVFRMFGIRTVVMGIELILPDGEVRRAAVRIAPVIHAADTASAVIAGLTRQVPPRPALVVTMISATNTILALSAAAALRASESPP